LELDPQRPEDSARERRGVFDGKLLTQRYAGMRRP
jgi:hypothetical protein